MGTLCALLFFKLTTGTSMIINWGELTPQRFLSEYWQKKPLLIKKGMVDEFEHQFIDPLDANELAGLAMEEEIQSRIISHKNESDWSVEHGPFEHFDQYGEKDWTLLVQATNNWSAETHQLLKPFNFIPSWRLDDVMVSFSTPGGGVGAHLDQYDVFIIQGEGKRHWQVALPDDSLVHLLPHPDLKQVSEITPVIDVITEPGDILYIPPNHAHKGTAIENSLNYSVGFQAPSAQELWSAFADKLLDQDLATARFADPDRQPTKNPNVMSDADKQALKQFMLKELDNEAVFNDFVSSYLTKNHHQLDIVEPEDEITPEQLSKLVEQQLVSIEPVLGLKSHLNQDKTKVYINGDSFELCPKTQFLAIHLANNEPLHPEILPSLTVCLKNNQLLTRVINMGYWYILD